LRLHLALIIITEVYSRSLERIAKLSNHEIITCWSREEWLAERHKVVSSTESAALFGMSPYLTPLELAIAKQQNEPAEFEANERMLWGTRLQDAIADGICEDYGLVIHPFENRFSRRIDLRMGSSFDYAISGRHVILPRPDNVLTAMYDKFGPGLLEIKNVDSLQFKKEWLDGEAPDHIEIQLQHQLQCVDYKWGAIAALVGGNRIELVIRERDDEVGFKIESKIRGFWQDLESGKLPDPTWPQDADFIAKLYNVAIPDKVINVSEGALDHDPDVMRWCEEYRQAHETLTIAQEVKDTRKAMILARIRDAEKVIAGKYRISASMVGPCHVEYDRKGYRDFRVTEPKVKRGKDSNSK
jgi:predicted phage-related endonuclease